MSRWEPDAQGRFRAAAMELFLERGYGETTVADIAQRAGLTARTFFRHFADKREVLFHGADRLRQTMIGALHGAPANATPFEAVTAALDASSEFFRDNREFARRRSQVIAANADLHERELIKLAKLSEALAEGLRLRGVTESDARLAAEAGIAVFRVAFGHWVAVGEQRTFGEILHDSLGRLRALTSNR